MVLDLALERVRGRDPGELPEVVDQHPRLVSERLTQCTLGGLTHTVRVGCAVQQDIPACKDGADVVESGIGEHARQLGHLDVDATDIHPAQEGRIARHGTSA